MKRFRNTNPATGRVGGVWLETESSQEAVVAVQARAEEDLH
jgi:hypothetical protein